jgi:hypothetical protein
MPGPSQSQCSELLVSCYVHDIRHFVLEKFLEKFHVDVEIRELSIVLCFIKDDLSVKCDLENTTTTRSDCYRYVGAYGLKKFGCHPGSHVVVASRNAVSDLRLYFA